MTSKLTNILILWVLILSSCAPNRLEDHRKTVSSTEFSITTSKYFHPVEGLHDFAPLQFYNSKKSIYLLGLSEAKSDLKIFYRNYTVEDYATFVTKNLGAHFSGFKIGSSGKIEINGLSAWITGMKGSINSSPTEKLTVQYYIAVVEGKDHFHQIVGWASPEEQDILSKEIKNMVCSFTENPGQDHTTSSTLVANK